MPPSFQPPTRAHINQQLVIGAFLGLKYTSKNVAYKVFEAEEELSAHAYVPTRQVALQTEGIQRGGI